MPQLKIEKWIRSVEIRQYLPAGGSTRIWLQELSKTAQQSQNSGVFNVYILCEFAYCVVNTHDPGPL
jgi:hypothetical protein